MPAELQQKALRGLQTAWLHSVPTDPELARPDRPLLVFLHGFPDTADSWSFQLEHFAAEYEIVAPYVRGAPPSEKAKDLSRYSIDSIGLDNLQILETVDPTRKRPILIVGHDLGSVHAWHLAEALKKRVVGLVIINGLTLKQFARRMTNPAQVMKSWYMLAMQVPVVPEMLLGKFTRTFLRRAHAAGGLSPERRPNEIECARAVVGPLNQYRAFMRRMPREVQRPSQRLRCPTLVIFGNTDAFLLPPKLDEFEADASDLTVRIVAGNHWLQRQNAEEINGLLAKFFIQAIEKHATARGAPSAPVGRLRSVSEATIEQSP